MIYDTSVELNSNSPLVKAFQEIEKRKATAKETLNDSPSKGKGSRSENDSKKIGGSKKKRNGNIESDDDEDDDDSVGVNSGWFPEAFTRAPNPLELASMQATLFSDDEDMNTKEQQVLDILAPLENCKVFPTRQHENSFDYISFPSPFLIMCRKGIPRKTLIH